jgi:DHA3 family macrolide efflux protein-like MFS transporter
VLTGPRRQLQVLDRAPAFRALFLAATASGLGTWLAVIALTVDVYDRTHSAKWVSALLVADFLPAVAIGLTLGPVVDRFSRWRLMIGSDLVSVGVFLALIFAGSPGQIVGLAAVAGFASGFFRPAAYAGLPNLVEEQDLPSANSLLRSITNLTTVVGTLLGGVVAGTAGPHVSYGLNAASFALSALFLSTIPARRLEAPEERPKSRGYVNEVKAGFALVLHSRALLAVFISWNLVMLANAGVNVSEIVLAKVSFGAGSFGFGLLWAGSGAGLVVGSLYAASWLEYRSVSFVYGAGLALMAFGALAAALSPDVWVGTLSLALGGSGNGAAIVCNSLLVQRGAPDHLRGRAFTTIMSANYALLGAGMALAGPITDAVGARWVFGGAAVLAGVAALVGRALTRPLGVLASADEAGAQPASAPG